MYHVKLRYQKVGEDPTWYFAGVRNAMTKMRSNARTFDSPEAAQAYAETLTIDNAPVSGVRVQTVGESKIVWLKKRDEGGGWIG